MAASSSSSPPWYTKLQEKFISATFTNCIIRVNIVDEDDGGKRQKLDEANHSKNNTVEIAAHSNILALRSPYFARALTCGWVEGQKMTVEISLGSAAAVEDLRLLLQLSYTESYIKDGDQMLDILTRMRLAELADALEFRDCIHECMSSFGEGLTLETALFVMDEVPEPLRRYEDAAKELERKVIKTLVEGIEELSDEDEDRTEAVEALMQAAGDKLAKFFGFIDDDFFEECTIPPDEGYLEDLLTMKSHIKELPFAVMEVLLKSDRLQVTSENDAFYLLWAWADDREEPVADFLNLVHRLRFHHMSLHYLANVVVHCPYLKNSEMLPEIMTVALSHREANPSLPTLRGQGHVLPKDRGLDIDNIKWKYKFTFKLERLLELDREENDEILLGLIIGYPISVNVKWHTEEHTEDLDGSFALYFETQLPWAEIPQAPSFKRVVGMSVRCVVNSGGPVVVRLFQQGDWGFHNWFPNKKWEEVVFEGSPYFPEGEMKVEVKIHLIMSDHIYTK